MKHFFAALCTLILAGTALPAFAAHATSAADQQFVVLAARAGTEEVREGRVMAGSNNADASMYAKRMIADHSKNNMQLNTLAQELGMVSFAARGAKSAPKAEAMPGKEYLTHEVSAHQDVIGLFQREAAGGHNQALRAFARMTLPVLQAHLELAQRLSGKP